MSPASRLCPSLRGLTLRLVVLTCAVCTLTGCVTSKKYRMAKEGTPPAKLLNWHAATPPAELTLESVIIFKGPGSWKREARWDEYVVQITNRGDQPMTLESAVLTDLQGSPQFPGAEPWALEKQSYTNWEKYGRKGVKLAAGAGVVMLYGAAVEASAAGSILAGGATTGAVAFLEVVPIIAVVDIGVVAVMNHNNKAAVQKEFDRRRLTLPRAVPVGTVAVGSIFYPMTPGPHQLIVTGKSGDTPFQLVLDLKPLAQLHLQTVALK